jgi:methylated-DNA-[protein]-cysteine S-methyltransferase
MTSSGARGTPGLRPVSRVPGALASGGLVHSPLGPIEIALEGDRLAAVRFVEGDYAAHPGARWPEVVGIAPRDAAAEVRRQLEDYLEGARRDFDLPLVPSRSPFAAAVRQAIRAIPFGATRTYASLAAELGRPTAARAVGRASALNPLPIVVPCHRLAGSDGHLRGYAGGLDLKRWLIEHERRAIARTG